MNTVDYLKLEGWQTGNVLFPGLEMIVNLPSNKFLWNYGTVDDIGKHVSLFAKEIGSTMNYNKQGAILNNKCEGKCLRVRLKNGGFHATGAVIFVRSNENKYELTFVYGHESTHALLFLNQEKYLLKALRKSGFNFDPFKKYDGDAESIANIGGWLALERLGKGPENLPLSDLRAIGLRYLKYGSDLIESRQK